MKQIAAVRDVVGTGGSNPIIFNWGKACQGKRERLFAAMTTVRAAEGGKFRPGDLVTVGYNASSNQVIMAAPSRSRIVAEVTLEAKDSSAIVKRLGWKVELVDVPPKAQGRFQKTPWEWLVEKEAAKQVSG